MSKSLLEQKALKTEFKPGSRLLKESIPVIPITGCIDLDITTGCNNYCEYCFKNLDPGQAKKMTVETAKDAIEWLFRASGGRERVAVNFMGGEPLLCFKEMKEIVKWGRRRSKSLGKSIYFSFTTNMNLFNEEIRRWVDENGLGVLMSIDGCPEVQDDQRPSKDGESKSPIIAKWAKSMLRTRPNSDARSTLMAKWIHRLFDSCVYLWEDIGFQSVMLAKADYDSWSEEHFEIYKLELDKIISYLINDFREGGEKRLAFFTFYAAKLIMPKEKGYPIESRSFPCGAGYNYSMVDPDGNIWPCHRFEGAARVTETQSAFLLGNIYNRPYNNSLSNALRSNRHYRFLKDSCSNCPVQEICAGGCPAANLEELGNDIYHCHDVGCRLAWLDYEKSKNYYHKICEIDKKRAIEFIMKYCPGSSDGK